MARATSPSEQKIAPVISMLPVKLRQAVDKLAEQGKVSRSEIGRRAIEQYVERKTRE